MSGSGRVRYERLRRPARHLALEEAVGPPEVREAVRAPVERVQRGERFHERTSDRGAAAVAERRGQRVADHPAVEPLGQVERRADDGRVEAGRDEARRRDARRAERTEEARFAAHRARSARYARRAAEDPRMRPATDEERLVRVAGRDARDLERHAGREALAVEPCGEAVGIAQASRELVGHRGLVPRGGPRGNVARVSPASHPILDCSGFDRVLVTVPLARDDLIQIKGTIVEALAGGNYRVKGDNGMEFLAKIGGRMRRYHIRVIPGDRVTIAVSPYDPSHGHRLPRCRGPVGGSSHDERRSAARVAGPA
jgi:translation initiation factor IF-1